MSTTASTFGASPTLSPDSWKRIDLAWQETRAAAQAELRKLARAKKKAGKEVTTEDREPILVRLGKKRAEAYGVELCKTIRSETERFSAIRSFSGRIADGIIADPREERLRPGTMRAIGALQTRGDIILDPNADASKERTDEAEDLSEEQAAIFSRSGEWQRLAPDDDEILWPDVCLRIRTRLIQALLIHCASLMNEWRESALIECVPTDPATQAAAIPDTEMNSQPVTKAQDPEPSAEPDRGAAGVGPVTPPARRSRASSQIYSPAAVQRLEQFLMTYSGNQTEFALAAATTDTTIRSFLRTCRVRRTVFANIARAMGMTREALSER